MRKCLLTAATAGLIAASLATPTYADDGGEVAGTLLGAGFGGLIGNQFGHGPGRVATTAAGVFVGGLVGNSLGASADRADRGYYGYANPMYYSYAAPVYYQQDYTPNYVAPPAPPPEAVTPYYDAAAENYCREYTQQIRVDGQVQESYGTACLQPDGTWRVVQ